MKIECACGRLISDATDALPHKAHLIADQSWNGLLEALDELIEHRGATPARRDAACMTMRTLLSRASRAAWQCEGCGRLHLDDEAGRLQTFLPSGDDTSRQALRARRPAPKR